jgi:hypothetical protein
LGTRNGDVVALDTTSGEIVWRQDVSDLGRRPGADREYPRCIKGTPAVHSGLAVVLVPPCLIAFSLEDGSIAWSYRWADESYGRDDGCLYAGHYHLVTKELRVREPDLFSYIRIDPTSGELLSKVEIDNLPARIHKRSFSGMVRASETHIFVAGEIVFAIKREDGRFSWGFRPDFFSDHYKALLAAGNRLLLKDEADLYCFAEGREVWGGTGPGGLDAAYAHPTEPSDGVLPFDIVEEVAEGTELVRQKVKGIFKHTSGDWVVFRCRLRGKNAAEFYFATRVEYRLDELVLSEGRALLWVEGVRSGEWFLRAAKKYFNPQVLIADFGRDYAKSPTYPRGESPGPPVPFDMLVIGQNVDGSAVEGWTEKGSWTATKWSDDKEETEFFVNWSPTEKRGYFNEREDLDRPGFCDRIASLLIRPTKSTKRRRR